MAWTNGSKPWTNGQSQWQPKWKPTSKWQPKWKPASKWQPKWVQSQRKWQPKWKSQQQGGAKIWVPSAPKNFTPDKDARYKGTVAGYWKWKGVGFIQIAQSGTLPVPKDQVFVHWSNIQSEDRFPFLQKDMQVEFGVMLWKSKNAKQIRAKHVTLPGGGVIALQDAADAEKKEFVGGQHLRYTGRLESYEPNKGTGLVLIDDGFELEDGVPKKLVVEESEVNAGGKRPRRYIENVEVEFGIWKSAKGKYKVYNMTLPGGDPVTPENYEHRKLSVRNCKGTIIEWWYKQGYGFIQPDPSQRLPASAEKNFAAMAEASKRRGKTVKHKKAIYFRKPDCQTGFWPKKGANVVFQLYTDDKGVGAADIH